MSLMAEFYICLVSNKFANRYRTEYHSNFTFVICCWQAFSAWVFNCGARPANLFVQVDMMRSEYVCPGVRSAGRTACDGMTRKDEHVVAGAAFIDRRQMTTTLKSSRAADVSVCNLNTRLVAAPLAHQYHKACS